MRMPSGRFWIASLVLLVGVFALFWAVAVGVRRQEGQPNVIVAKDRTFSFSLPAEFPVPEGHERGVPKGEAAGEIVDFTSESERGSFIVRSMRIPDEVWTVRTTKQMLDEARDNMFQLPEAYLDREAAVDYRGRPRRSFRLHTVTPLEIQYTRMDYILARPMLYILSFSSADQAELEEPDVERFFQSLELFTDVRIAK
jgi:hypothetical protein